MRSPTTVPCLARRAPAHVGDAGEAGCVGIALATILLAVLLSGCDQRAAEVKPVAASAADAPTKRPATDAWVGTWTGPEGTFLRIAPAQDGYAITIRNLDGPRTFHGVAQGDHVAFERDATHESIRAGNGVQTGMKWLADKTDCLVVKPGEGYCRD